MAFIEKLGEKISSGVNAVSDSTKKVTESARINNEISNNQKEIDRILHQIGICVRARLLDSINDEEILQLSARIDQINTRNNELAAELKAVKGITYCSNCNTELAPGTMFCPECGTKNTAQTPTQTPFTPAPESQPAAPKKVVSVRPVAAKPVEAAAPEPAPAPSPVPNKQFCPNCGYGEDLDGLFCSNCGTRLK